MGSDSCLLFDPVDVDLALDRLIADDGWAPVAQYPPTPRGLRYDRAFEPSVRAGYLTIQEAIQRGDREAYVVRLESRFDLPHDLAVRVADGRTRLKPAVEECERRHAITSVGRAINWPRIATVLVLVAMASGFFGAVRLARQQQIARQLENAALAVRHPAADAGGAVAPGQAPPPGRVERDADGWVTRVTAGHPADALSTFCSSAIPESGCSTLDVRQSKPRFPGRRLGRFTLEGDGQTWVVPIRRERGSGRWTIGTGLRPISPTAQTPFHEYESVWPHAPEFVPVEENLAFASRAS